MLHKTLVNEDGTSIGFEEFTELVHGKLEKTKIHGIKY